MRAKTGGGVSHISPSMKLENDRNSIDHLYNIITIML